MLSLRGYSSDPRKCGKPAEECAPRIKEGDITFTGPNVALDTKFVKEKVYDGYEFEVEYLHEGGTLQDCSIRNGDVFRIIEEILEPYVNFKELDGKIKPVAGRTSYNAIDQSLVRRW